MTEIIDGWAVVITSIVNFLFEMKFTDGTSVGGYILAACAMGILIRFIFRSTWNARAIGNDIKTFNQNRNNEEAAVRAIELHMRGSN